MTGSPMYLSPQIKYNLDVMEGSKKGKKMEWDFFKSDVFSLGLTLLCTATLKNSSNLNVFQQHLDKRI